MAEGGDTTLGSDMEECDSVGGRLSVTCHRCTETTKHMKYCRQCQYYICSICESKHTDIFSDHLVVDWKFATKSTPTRRCPDHTDNLVDMYCMGHDIVCCSQCIIKNHRSCTKQSLTDAAMGIKGSFKHGDVIDELQKTLANLTGLLDEVKEHKSDIDKSHETAMDKINKSYEQVLEAAVRWKHDIMSDLEERKNNLDVKSDELQEELSDYEAEVNEAMKEICEFKGNNECKLFDIITQSRQLVKQVKAVIRDSNITPKPLTVKLPNVNEVVEKIKQFGHIKQDSDTPICERQPMEQIAVTTNQDVKRPHITDICQLSDGSILLVDNQNKAIKRLGDPTCFILLPDRPRGICEVGPNKVAVTLDTRLVLIDLSYEEISVKHLFAVPDEAYGLTFCRGHLYICMCSFGYLNKSSYIGVYTLRGQLALKYDIQANTNKALFSVASNIICDGDEKMIYVTDSKKGVVLVNSQGTLILTVHTTDMLKTPNAICTGPNREVLVAWSDSNIIGALTNQGVKSILSEKDAIDKPSAICYDKVQERLVVVNKGSDKLNIYDIS